MSYKFDEAAESSRIACQAHEYSVSAGDERSITFTVAPHPIIAQDQRITAAAHLMIQGRGGRELARFDTDGTVWIEGERMPGDPADTVRALRRWCDAVAATHHESVSHDDVDDVECPLSASGACCYCHGRQHSSGKCCVHPICTCGKRF